MIQLKDLNLEMTEVLDSKLGSVVGGIQGKCFNFILPILGNKPSLPDRYNTPSLIPTLPAPDRYPPEQALHNFGVLGSDGRTSDRSNGNGAGIF